MLDRNNTLNFMLDDGTSGRRHQSSDNTSFNNEFYFDADSFFEAMQKLNGILDNFLLIKSKYTTLSEKVSTISDNECVNNFNICVNDYNKAQEKLRNIITKFENYKTKMEELDSSFSAYWNYLSSNDSNFG